MGCDKAKKQLLLCLKNSECIKTKTATECLQKEHRPKECDEAYVTFYHCKRAMLDPRYRFKGNVFE